MLLALSNQRVITFKKYFWLSRLVSKLSCVMWLDGLFLEDVVISRIVGTLRTASESIKSLRWVLALKSSLHLLCSECNPFCMNRSDLCVHLGLATEMFFH